jgi:hypothetical protein
MPQKDKKKEPKKRPEEYDHKVMLEMTFEDAIKKLAEKANNAVAAALKPAKG